MDARELELRNKVIEIGQRMLANNLVQGTWGNISVQLDENTMLVTPSGLDYDRLKPEDLPIVNMTTMEWTGTHKPTSEKRIHAALLTSRPEITAVVHSHPVNCSIFACTHSELPVMNADMQKYVGGTARTATYGIPGTKKLTKGTVKGIAGRNACFMANHGVTCCGTDLETAYKTCAVLDSSAEQYINETAMKQAGVTKFTPNLIPNLFLKKHKK